MIKLIVSNSGVVITNTEPVNIPLGDSVIVDGEEYVCVRVRNENYDSYYYSSAPRGKEYFYGFEKKGE